MNKFYAKKNSLNSFELFKEGQSICQINMPTVVWVAEKTVASKFIGSGLSRPTVLYKGVKFYANMFLLTNKFFFNEYRINFEQDEKETISAIFSKNRFVRTTEIQHNDRHYVLERSGLFSMEFKLYKDGQEIATIVDDTKFTNLSAARTYAVTYALDDDELLVFAFFLSVCVAI